MRSSVPAGEADSGSRDVFRDECGVFGVFGHSEAANITYLGLHALQHRGQESAGIVSSDGLQLRSHRAMGLVQECFSARTIAELKGSAAIGHVRYSTAGASHVRNAQPFTVQYARGWIAVAHNGNLTNADDLRTELEEEGSIFQSSMDTEAIVHLIARSQGATLVERIIEALLRVEGAHSLLFLSDDRMVAVRDPHGFRPLCLGRLQKAWVVASESTAFDLIDAEFVREVLPGEVVSIDADGLRSFFPFPARSRRMCIFEHIYFARPDSVIDGLSVYEVRKRLGRQLAREAPAAADVAIPVPDSGTPAAIGFAAEMGVPFEMGFIRSHYVGRTFIEPQQSIRHFGVRLKLNPVRAILRGRRVVVVDDSIVRGTTSRKIIRMVQAAGASEVHVRISSPPTRWPCYYGIDTPTRRELIAAGHGIDEIREFIGATSLAYLSIEGAHAAVDGNGADRGYCDACFSGDYPVQPRRPARTRQVPLGGFADGSPDRAQ